VLAACGGARIVLDVGCSAGALAAELARRGAVVDGIELDPDAARAARQHCRTVICGDLLRADLTPIAGERYDAIVLADVLEHIANPDSALQLLRPLLAHNGRIVVSTPNIANWSIRLLLLAGRFEYQERGILDRTHLHFFTKRSLLHTLAANGLRVVRLDVTCPLPAPVRRPPLTAWAHAAGLMAPSLLAYQFVVTAVASDAGQR
jgi:2-polyprenyl-3-methyl-5-hydroxy-6-metoxy-1,4-benzoquinol methylase